MWRDSLLVAYGAQPLHLKGKEQTNTHSHSFDTRKKINDWKNGHKFSASFGLTIKVHVAYPVCCFCISFLFRGYIRIIGCFCLFRGYIRIIGCFLSV